MTTAVTTTVVNMTTDAGFRAWVAELVTMLFTTLGVTQTSDTGQINTSTVTRPASANTSGGYVIGSFNDTAQSTSPVFFKLEFGTGTTPTTDVQMWITVGTGSNGSGTINGTTMTRVSMGSNTPSSTTASYTTRACYNTTDGVLWLGWKYGGAGTANETLCGFFLFRSNNSSGTPTTDAVMLITNGRSASAGSTYGYLQAISYLSGLAYNTSPPFDGSQSGANWGFWPFTLTATVYSGNAYVGPCFQFTPVPGISNWYALCLNSEIAVGTTASVTMIGSTAHTYINAGSVFATNNFTYNGIYSATTYGLMLPWE